MAVPHFREKHAGRSYVTAQRLLAYRAEHGRQVQAFPSTVVVSWQNGLLERVRAARQVREVPGPVGSVLEVSPQLGFARVPLGAPVIAIVLEELAAQGVEAVVGIGDAGAIGAGLGMGQPVVCSAALRDEGTSHHYSSDGPWALPDADLLDRLRVAIPEARVGPTWTTDAPYRETAEEILAYQQDGILTVEMEASAMFTVGACVGIRTPSVFSVSDVLHGDEWQPQFHSAGLDEARWHLFERVEAALVGPW